MKKGKNHTPKKTKQKKQKKQNKKTNSAMDQRGRKEYIKLHTFKRLKKKTLNVIGH